MPVPAGKAFTLAMTSPLTPSKSMKATSIFNSPAAKNGNNDILNRTADMRKASSGIFLNDLVNADKDRSVFNQTHKPKMLTTAEAERWKEFNSYEPRNHN